MSDHQLTSRQCKMREFWLMFLFAFARLPLPICKGNSENVQETETKLGGQSER